MRRLRKKIAFILIAAAMFAAFSASVPASSTVNKLFDYSSILAPGQPMPTPRIEPAEEVYKNPYMSYKPFHYVKGGLRYSDFAGLPDFAQYAQVDGEHEVVYPPKTESFYFFSAPEIIYTYRSKIIDYIGVKESVLKNYKTFIKSLGFVEMKKLSSEAFRDYVEIIEWELRYDSDFKLDTNGVYVVEDLETFRWLLIGKSITYDGAGVLTECVEFRFYSLTRTGNDPFNILEEVGRIEDIGDIGRTVTLFTPDALKDITNVTDPPAHGLYTPDALKDLTETNVFINK